ncbi:DedA family protein [Candidatus Gracilibacteria bacterium]|nr:DedA family protein [Candidatus Gracilibacteria bacterium]MCF7898763.1 DedA family protein [Candidatus Paceibacterota bacterium]
MIMHGYVFDFISTYGYLAVFVWSIFEGETVVLLAGALSYNGYLSFYTVIIWAFLGAAIGDFGWYLLGRYKGEKIFNKYPKFKKFVGKPVALVNKYPERLAFLMRFMYGFRHVVPFSLGMSSITTGRFIFWNSLGGVCWAFVFSGIGFVFINIIVEVFGHLRKSELLLIIITISIIVLIGFAGKNLKRFLKRKIEDSL